MSKITIDKAVLEQAIEWFEWFHNGSTIASPASSTQVMRTLREALAQQQPEPYGYLYEGTAEHTRAKTLFRKTPETRLETRWWREVGPIYTSPQAQPQPVQEPVAWIERDMNCDDFDPDSVTCQKPDIAAEGWEWVPLYTTPQAQPQPVQEQVAPVGTVTRYLGNDGYMKWAFQPEAAAWLVPRDQRAAERGAESCFSVYTSPQAQPLIEVLTELESMYDKADQITPLHKGMRMAISTACYRVNEVMKKHGITKGTT